MICNGGIAATGLFLLCVARRAAIDLVRQDEDRSCPDTVNRIQISKVTMLGQAVWGSDTDSSSLKKPVIGLLQHSSNGSPNKFFSVLMKFTFQVERHC